MTESPGIIPGGFLLSHKIEKIPNSLKFSTRFSDRLDFCYVGCYNENKFNENS